MNFWGRQRNQRLTYKKMFNWLINILLTLILSQAGGIINFPNESSFEADLINFNTEAEMLTLAADKAYVQSFNNRAVLYSKKADEVQPIASITKLMTALVFLDYNPGWEEVYTITKEDNIEGGRLNLFLGERVKIKDILATSLIASDNGATLALVNASGLSQDEFVAQMNFKASALGLKQTKFFDPTGLNDANVSTAREVAFFAKEVLSRPEIEKLVKLKEYNFITENGREKKIESTNYLLFDDSENNFSVVGAKTGYTDKAGYCFVGLFAGKDGREIISVVLNSDGRNERFRESKRLVNWVFANYHWTVH